MEQEEGYLNVDLPCEIIWGKCDQTVRVYVAYMLEHQLPNAGLTIIPRCKHAPFLECPTESAGLVREADRQNADRGPGKHRLATTYELR